MNRAVVSSRLWALAFCLAACSERDGPDTGSDGPLDSGESVADGSRMDEGGRPRDGASSIGPHEPEGSADTGAVDAASSLDGSVSDAAGAPDAADAADAAQAAPKLNLIRYRGRLDANGNATVDAPAIVIGNFPLVVGYVFTSAYAEPGFMMLGNIIPRDSTFRFAAGAANAGAEYTVVVATTPIRVVRSGSLDASGNATVSAPEIQLEQMPLIAGYVFTSAYAEPGYVMLGNIIPARGGAFRFAAGAHNANARYLLVTIARPNDLRWAGKLDMGGNATVAIPGLKLASMPLLSGYVFTNAYAEPGYVMLGNILPRDNTLRFAAGATSADASFIAVGGLDE